MATFGGVTLASYKPKKKGSSVTGDNMRDPNPGWRYDLLTGEKYEVYNRPSDFKHGSSDHAVNVPLSVSGLGVSEPPSLAKSGPSTLSHRVLCEDLRCHARTPLEPSDRFDKPATTAMELGFKPAAPLPPQFGRKACQETIIEEYQIMGPRMP